MAFMCSSSRPASHSPVVMGRARGGLMGANFARLDSRAMSVLHEGAHFIG